MLMEDFNGVLNTTKWAKIEAFSDPTIFKLLDIPKPLRSEVISEGQGGRRIAYFDSRKIKTYCVFSL